MSDSGLSSIKVQSAGKLLALGSLDGTVTVVQLSRGLWEQQKDEKAVISQMFERETRREKNLELRYIQRKRDQKEKEKRDKEEQKQKEVQQISLVDAEDDEETKEILRKAEEEFYTAIDLGTQAVGQTQNPVEADPTSGPNTAREEASEEADQKAKGDDAENF